MKIDLSGKSALVTGSTAGIGKAIATGLAGAGATVFVNGRKQAAVDAAAHDIRAKVAGATVHGIAADVSTAAGCQAIVAAAPQLDILVNNAGIYELKDFFDIPDEDWTRFFETNVMSGVRLSRAYMQGMLGRNWGRIIFISSESGLYIPKEMIHYGFTKSAQLSVARGLAELTAGTGVTVNSVLPGPTYSDGIAVWIDAAAKRQDKPASEIAEAFVKRARPSSLLQRMATVDEVANMVVYAASTQASATNGAALRVEGGIVRTIA
jgi:NAD(P)-dependent dehydrogenase (short-subunit alcohol dehydrogenase family)